MLYLQFTLAIFLGFEVLTQFLFGIAVLYYQSALSDSRIFRAGITFTINMLYELVLAKTLCIY